MPIPSLLPQGGETIPAVLASGPVQSLASRSIASLRTFFATRGHRPSQDHWRALEALAATMQDMAEGTAEPRIFLSACDPGVGKTRTVVHFARGLVASPAHGSVGMLVCVCTIAEAMALAAALQDIRDSLAVVTSDAAANALGDAIPAAAQVLITTQNRLGRLTEDRPFAAATGFHYLGQPRAVRVWDESVLPGKAYVIGADALMSMASRLRTLCPDMVAKLYAFGAAMLALDDGAAVEVPEFEASGGTTLAEVVAFLSSDNGTEGHARDRETAAALQVVAGRRVRVRRDGLKGSAVLTFREELPTDLPPMLVLDASGRVRETYALWQASRRTLSVLPAAVRDYGPLTVKVWRTSGSKSGWARNRDRLVDGIVATIASKPEEEWLVVVHRASGTLGDTEHAIRAKLGADTAARVRFTTWGRHTGSNDWVDVPNVILAGTLFYPGSHLTALHHLCADIPVEDGLVDLQEVRGTEQGEHRHLMLQAICRGRVRRSDGNRCQPMTAYVVASPRSGIAGELATVFPGCSVEAWNPLGVTAKGKTREAVEFLTEALTGGRTEVSYSEVYGALGMQNDNFKRIAKHPAWMLAVTELGAEVIRGVRGALFVRLLPDGA